MSPDIRLKIDKAFDETEDTLSIMCAFPVVGTIAGLSKVLMGVAQTIVGVAGGIFTLNARYNGDNELNDYFWTHALHGLGNILAGTLEAIPCVGLVIVSIKAHKQAKANRSQIQTGYEPKFMPYESLCVRDLRITHDQIAVHLFNQSLAQTAAPPSLKEKYALAEQAILQAYSNRRAFWSRQQGVPGF